jgi:hypothetical protein
MLWTHNSRSSGAQFFRLWFRESDVYFAPLERGESFGAAVSINISPLMGRRADNVQLHFQFDFANVK